MLANFEIQDGNSVRPNPDGTPALYRGFFRPSECIIIDSWDMTGMRGTGSHDWTVTDVFVPERRTVHVDGRLLTNQWHRWPGTLYALPVHALVGPTTASSPRDRARWHRRRPMPAGSRAGWSLRENARSVGGRAEVLLGRATFRAAALATCGRGSPVASRRQQRARCPWRQLCVDSAASDGLDVPRRGHTRATHSPAVTAGATCTWSGRPASPGLVPVVGAF
jgi:hypothetical protein